MLKVAAIVSIMIVGMLHAASTSCDSCGSECASACGSRRFRTCCFNYLRKKRGPDTPEFWAIPNREDADIPVFFLRYIPEDWSLSASDLKLNQDTTQNRLTTS